jgi:hypothetical protein
MILFFGMQLVPLAYGILYLVHSFRKRRRGQGIAALSLLLVLLASLSVLMWEFLTLP